MINKTQAKILRALRDDSRNYSELQKATGLSNPFGYIAELITFNMVVNLSQNISKPLYRITRDGVGVIDVYDRIEAHKARFSA
jgi:DNA-binding HxlR family transcriptional regulator